MRDNLFIKIKVLVWFIVLEVPVHDCADPLLLDLFQGNKTAKAKSTWKNKIAHFIVRKQKKGVMDPHSVP